MQDSGPLGVGLDRLLGNVKKAPALERLSVGGREALSLCGRKEVEVVLTYQLFASEAEQLLSSGVEAHESKVFGVLDENHVGDVLDDRVQELIGGRQLSRTFGNLFLQLARGQLLVSHLLRGGDCPGCAGRKTLEELDVRFAERGTSFQSIEIESADHSVLGDHRNHGRLTHPPLLNVARLVRGDVLRKMIGVDFDDQGSAFSEHRFPWPGGCELYGGAKQAARVPHQLRIGMVGRDGLDGGAVWREQDHRAEVPGGTRNLLGDNSEKRLDVRNCVDECVGRRRNRCQARAIVAFRVGGRAGPTFGHGATLVRRTRHKPHLTGH